MVTRVPPATGPYNGHTISTDVTFGATVNLIAKYLLKYTWIIDFYFSQFYMPQQYIDVLQSQCQSREQTALPDSPTITHGEHLCGYPTCTHHSIRWHFLSIFINYSFLQNNKCTADDGCDEIVLEKPTFGSIICGQLGLRYRWHQNIHEILPMTMSELELEMICFVI